MPLGVTDFIRQGVVIGTPIGPHYFISARHIGEPLATTLQSAAAPQGPYLDDTTAVVDVTARTITIPTSPTTRFYRLSNTASLTIQSVNLSGSQLIFRYRKIQGTRPNRLGFRSRADIPEGANPRFVVTNLPKAGFGDGILSAQKVYEDVYCARGNMENVLKQQVLDLEADRMSTHYLASNQLRLWLATFAYLMMDRLRALTLQGTELAQATAGTIRVKLLKVAAAVKVSVRRIYVQFCSAFPMQEVFTLCLSRLKATSWQTG